MQAYKLMSKVYGLFLNRFYCIQ